MRACSGALSGVGRLVVLVSVLPVLVGLSSCSHGHATSAPSTTPPDLPSRPAVYGQAGADMFAPGTEGALPRIYVPNTRSGTVSVIDPVTAVVVDTFRTGVSPQHVVPSWDLQTLWVNNNGGSLTPIDPRTARPGATVPIADPYNMYFTPDGASMIVVAEAAKRLDFRDPHTLALQSSLSVPCKGVNHIDFSADGAYFLATCEFAGRIIKVDTTTKRVVGSLDFTTPDSQPQDVRLVPDGRFFYVADMMGDGVHAVDGDHMTEVGFLPTGPGTHGVYPSRDGTRLYVTNRGSHDVYGKSKGPGDVVVVDFDAGKVGEVVERWPVPGGGSPDMGNVSADGSQFWVSGRYDDVVYDFDTKTGEILHRVTVGKGPHGLTVWPQPGRISLGHTGNMR